MTIQQMDNVLIVVEDLEAAKAFFAELGMELEGEAPVEGRSVDRVVGLKPNGSGRRPRPRPRRMSCSRRFHRGARNIETASALWSTVRTWPTSEGVVGHTPHAAPVGHPRRRPQLGTPRRGRRRLAGAPQRLNGRPLGEPL